MQSIDELASKLNPREWEDQVFSLACEWAQVLAGCLLEKLDEALMERREGGLVVEGRRARRILTRFGYVTVKRRVYREGEGKRRYLLDEALGLERRCLLTPAVTELSAALAGYIPFGKCEEVLRRLLPAGVSHTTVHRQVARLADPSLAREEQDAAQCFEQGKPPESGERQVPVLLIEADGVSVALQRERERRGEVKLGIAYEGWEEVAGGRYRLKDKTVYLDLGDGDRFWEGFSLTLAKKYDLARVGQVVIGGDGARWVREGAGFLGAVYQLDRFHLRRALLRGLGGDVELANRVYRACVTGDVSAADALLMAEQLRLRDREYAAEVASLRGYLLDNAFGLGDYRLKLAVEAPAGLRGLGAIEGNVDKLVASRMKKRGMSWTRRGARRMARLLQMLRSGEDVAWTKLVTSQPAPALAERVRGPGRPRKKGGDGTWLNMDLPALHGPHRNRPWVQVLKTMAEGNELRRFKPTFR